MAGEIVWSHGKVFRGAAKDDERTTTHTTTNAHRITFLVVRSMISERRGHRRGWTLCQSISLLFLASAT